MEGIPHLVDLQRLPVEIPVYPYFFDHHLEGRAVFPAVEALQVLAEAVGRARPGISVADMTQGRFEKFLDLPAGSSRIQAFVEIEPLAGGDVRAVLLTRNRPGKAPVTRLLVHAAVSFPQNAERDAPSALDLHGLLEGVCVEVSPEDIYRELVPFGLSYQNIAAPLHISEHGASVRIRTPVDLEPQRNRRLLGSPFALDAAFHAACVWSQCYRETVAFPVGFERRSIYHPTNPAEIYFGCVLPVRTDASVLVFDIWIYDCGGNLCESVRGLRMQDVSGGRATPPLWIKRAGKGRLLENIRRNCRDLCVSEIKTLFPFAKEALSAPEKKRSESMGKKRTESFLAARLACKRLSRRISGEDPRGTPAGAISTLCPDLRRPCCRHIGTQREMPCCVAHDDRFVIAVLADGPAGVDVEKLSPRVLRSLDLFMDASERRLVASAGAHSIETALRIWSIKEAVAKALDLNLAEAWQRVTVRQAGRDRSRFGVDSNGSFVAFHDAVDDHVFTYTGMT